MRTLTSREKRVLTLGAVAAAGVLVFGYLVLPLARKWNEMGDRLEPKLEYVAKLRAHVEGHDSLLARRNALARRLGSLSGLTAEKPKEDEAKPDAEDDKKEDVTAETQAGDEPQQEDQEENAQEAAAPKDTAEEQGDGKDETAAENEAEGGDDEKADGASPPETTQTAEEVCLAAYVERVSKKAGVKIKRISPKKSPRGAKSSAHFVPAAIQFNIEAGIQDLVKMLTLLEKGDRFVRIEQLQLQRSVDKPDPMEVTLDVMAYEAKAR